MQFLIKKAAQDILSSEKTIAYIGYDKKNLYIAVRCFDSDPNAIRALVRK